MIGKKKGSGESKEMLTYKKLMKSPKIFKQLSGLSLEEFNKVVENSRDGWQELEASKKCYDRKSHLESLEDKILSFLMYYTTYITHTFLGYLFNLHNANICRLFKKLEPLLTEKFTIKKDRLLTPEKILKILADVTEQPTQKPKKAQKKSYSGKKKAHTIKIEIMMEDAGRLIKQMSRSYIIENWHLSG